jgi:hypothetical protein
MGRSFLREFSQSLTIRGKPVPPPEDPGYTSAEPNSSSAATPAPTPNAGPQASSPDDKATYLDQQYRAWLAERDCPRAVESLSGLSQDEIQKRVDELSPDDCASLHEAALKNPRAAIVAAATDKSPKTCEPQDLQTKSSDPKRDEESDAEEAGKTVVDSVIWHVLGHTQFGHTGGPISIAIETLEMECDSPRKPTKWRFTCACGVEGVNRDSPEEAQKDADSHARENNPGDVPGIKDNRCTDGQDAPAD